MESPLWWAGELPEPRCQGFLLGGGAANNDEKGRAVRACCGLVRHFYDGVPRRQGRERNTDHACLISCQYDCTKSSYNDLNFVQKHGDHPLEVHILHNFRFKGQYFIQTEAERRRREGVKQSMEIRLRSCMYVCMYVPMYVGMVFAIISRTKTCSANKWGIKM